MGDRIVEVLIKAKDTTANAIGKFRRRMRGVEQTIKQVTRVVFASTAAIAAMVLGLTKLGERGDKVNAVKRAFAKITGDETAALERLRKASKGMVDDMQLMSLYNQSLALGAAGTTEEFARQIEVVNTLARAQGLTLSEGLEKFTVGMARMSKLRLDDLGITLDVAKANEDFAASLGKSANKLTDNEKAVAFRNAAMREATRLADSMATAEDRGSSATVRFSTAITNLRDSLAVMVAKSPEVAAFFDSFTTVIEDLAEIVATGDTDLLKRAFTELGRIAGNAFSIAMKEAVSGARGFVGSMMEAFAPELDENQRRGLEDQRSARGVFGIGGGDRRGLFEFLFDKIEGSLSESAELARENIEVATAALSEIAAEARARAAAAGSGGGGGGTGGGGGGATAGLDLPGIPFRRVPSGFSADAIAAFQARQARRQRVRLGPAVMAPGSFGLAPGMVSGGLTDEQRAQIDADTIREGADAMGEAGQVVAASMFGMAQAAIRGSDQVAQSVVGMITQIAQSLPGVGGIFGTIIGGVGGLIGAAFSRNRDPVPVRIRDIDDAAARKLANNGQPIRITTITEVGGVEIEHIERELLARQNRDEVVRFSRGRAVLGG